MSNREMTPHDLAERVDRAAAHIVTLFWTDTDTMDDAKHLCNRAIYHWIDSHSPLLEKDAASPASAAVPEEPKRLGYWLALACDGECHGRCKECPRDRLEEYIAALRAALSASEERVAAEQKQRRLNRDEAYAWRKRAERAEAKLARAMEAVRDAKLLEEQQAARKRASDLERKWKTSHEFYGFRFPFAKNDVCVLCGNIHTTYAESHECAIHRAHGMPDDWWSKKHADLIGGGG